MNKRWSRIGGLIAVLAVAVLAVILWPASDPLAGVETAAVQLGDEPARPSGVDFESELSVVLGDRNIRIVGNESEADVVLSLTDLTVNLGDIEISFGDGSFRGRASAVCTLADVRTGKVHVMDFHISVENGAVRAELVGRKFWEFWK